MIKKILPAFTVEKLIQRFLAVWCIINTYSIFSTNVPFYDISFTFGLELVIWALLFVMVFITFSLLDIIFCETPFTPWLFALSFGIYAAVTLTIKRDFWYCLAMIILAAIALNFLLKSDKLRLNKIKIGTRLTKTTVAVCAAVICGFIATIGCLRYATYSSPNFDFGIWCNMFYHMKEEFWPIVSSERDKLLSHFAVHISPIYYLILPFYIIFPSPYTLQISQAVIIASGIIPLYLLCRHKGLSNKFIATLSVAYAFSPALIAGIGYDMHENCFLVPLLLWLFYFFEKEKYPLMYLSALGVCMVKEDAAIFVLFFGIYAFLSRQKYLHGIILALGSIVCFGSAVLIINTFGDGVLASRFDNYMYQDEGLIGMAKIIITNPAYVFTQVLSSDKLIYLLKLLLPLGFLPLATKKVSRFILLLPMMLINLMVTYSYQYNIDFQYSFGAAACLIYLAVINAAELKGGVRRYMTCLAAVAAIIIFLPNSGNKINYLSERYENGQYEFSVLNSALDLIPDEASVKSSTFFIPHIAQRNEIYEITSENETDFAVFDMRPSLVDETTALREYYYSLGYTAELDEEGYILILKNPESTYSLEK